MSNSAQSAVALPLEGTQRALPKLALAPTAEAPQPAATPVETKDKRPPIMRRAILGAVILAALSGAAYYGHHWYVLGRFQVSTDDAYVKTDMAQLGAKVAGYVTEIPAAENAAVKAGDIILKLDDGDYKLAVDAAKARIETQKAVIDGFASQTEAQKAQIAAAEARLASAQAEEGSGEGRQWDRHQAGGDEELARGNGGEREEADPGRAASLVCDRGRLDAGDVGEPVL